MSWSKPILPTLGWSKSTFHALSQVPRSRIVGGAAAVVTAAYLVRRWTRKNSSPPASTRTHQKNNVAVNREFVKQLLKLLRIAIPGVFSKEFFLFSAHSVALVIRTFLSIYVARLDGAIVKSIVSKNTPAFIRFMAKWLGVAIPATFINSLIRYLESNLALSLRSRLVEYAYKLYLSNETYYGVSNLDSRLANPDQCLTDDLEKFASAAAHLYSNISKPLLDVVLMLGALVHTAAKQTKREGIALQLVLGIGTAAATSGILRLVSPRFGKLVVEEAEKSGYLRYLHSRLVTNSEEIAFYGGNKVELSMLQRAYKALSNFKRIIFMKRLYYVFFEQFFMKYIWTGTGMVMIAIPIMTGHGHQTSDTVSGTISDRSQWYTTARSLMVSGADALERIMSSYKEVAEMAGYTSRVSNMFAVFEDVGSGHYRRAVVTQPSSGNSPQSEKERKKASTEEKETEEPGSGSDSYRF